MKSIYVIKSSVLMCISSLALVLGLASYPSISLAYTNQVQVNVKLENQLSKLVAQVLKSTEQALSLAKDNSEDSFKYVQGAIVAVQNIENMLSADTHANSKSPVLSGNSKEYWFLYPGVDNALFNNNAEYPTLNQKLKSGVLYRGNLTSEPINFTAYFDFAFAKASLLTAKDAFTVQHTQEAIRSLRRVFEAVYISPDFLIATQNIQFQLNNYFNRSKYDDLQGLYLLSALG